MEVGRRDGGIVSTYDWYEALERADPLPPTFDLLCPGAAAQQAPRAPGAATASANAGNIRGGSTSNGTCGRSA